MVGHSDGMIKMGSLIEAVPFVRRRVRDPSVGDVRPLHEASPLWASRIVVRWRSDELEAVDVDADEEAAGWTFS